MKENRLQRDETLPDLRHKVKEEEQSKFFLPGFTKLLHFSHRGTSSEKIFSTNQRELNLEVIGCKYTREGEKEGGGERGSEEGR